MQGLSSNVRTLLEHVFQHHSPTGVRTFQHLGLSWCWNIPVPTPAPGQVLVCSLRLSSTGHAYGLLPPQLVTRPPAARRCTCPHFAPSQLVLGDDVFQHQAPEQLTFWSVLCPPSTYCTHSVCRCCNELIYYAPLSVPSARWLGPQTLRASSESDCDLTSFPTFEA